MDFPDPPDPYETANAQFGANTDASIAGALINNYNENSPFGSVNYTEGTPRSFTDSQGNKVNVPNLTRNVTLSPDQQAILDQQNAASRNLAGLAARQSGMLSDYLATPFDPNYTYSFDHSNVTPSQREWVEYTPEQLTAMSGGGQGSAPGGQAMQYGVQQGFKPSLPFDDWKQQEIETRRNTGAPFSDDFGGNDIVLPNRTDYDDFVSNERSAWEQEQRNAYLDSLMAGSRGGPPGMEPNGGGQEGAPGGYWRTTPGQGPTLQRTEREQMLEQWARGPDAPELLDSYGPTDFSEDRLRVEDAWMDRYNRLFDDRQESFEAQMRNQGLTPGAEYYNDQFRTKIADPLTDATNQAIVMGGQEQSRLADLARQQAMFTNSSRLGQFGAEQGSANQRNALRQAQFQEALAQRNQPINEIAALMSGTQLNVPQFTGPFQQGISPAPIADLVQADYDARLQNAQASAQGMFGLLGNLIPMLPF